MKKIISMMIVCALIFTQGTFATGFIDQNHSKIITTYNSEEEKNQIIQDLKSENTNALIFESQEEADEFFNNLEIEFIEEQDDELSLARNAVTNRYTISITTTLVNRINLHYQHTTTNKGRQFGYMVGNPYMTYTGYTPGTTADLSEINIRKISPQILEIFFGVHFKYYILVDGFVQIGAQDSYFKFRNDVMRGHYEV